MITDKHRKKFKSCVKNLNNLLKEIQEYESGANYYINEDSVVIHTKSHTHKNDDIWYNSAEASEILYNTDCGGYWKEKVKC